MSTDEITEAQEQLGKALDRARAGEDKELAKRVREAGEKFVNRIAGLLRLTKVHDFQNAAFKAPIEEFFNLLTQLNGVLGAVHMISVDEQVYINDIRVRFDVNSTVGEFLNKTLKRHQTGGISFHDCLDRAQLKQFIGRLTDPPPSKGARAALQIKLNEDGLKAVELLPVFRFKSHGEEVQTTSQKAFSEVYGKSSQMVAEAWGNLSNQRMPNPLPIRRLVTELIDLSEGDNGNLLQGEESEQNPPYVNHSLRVSALALLIGRALNLSNAALSDLGVAAVFHDMGYTAKENGYAPPFERHGSACARLLLKQRGFHEAKIRRLMACLQHHEPFNAPRKPTLFARIIRIVDDYDTLTRNRGKGPLMVPADAIAYMAGSCGTEYDPTLFQLFVNEIGVYPPGTLVTLSDQSIAIVSSGARSPETFAQPLVQVLFQADGNKLEEPIMLDMAEEDVGVYISEVIRPD